MTMSNLPARVCAYAACAAMLAVTTAAHAAITLVPVITTGLSSPIFVTHANDGTSRLFIVEQPGRIKVLQPGATTPTDFLNIQSRVLSGGERGLLGLAFHPSYRTNGRFFVFYTRQTDGTIVIAEYRVSATDPNVASTAETPLFTIAHPATNHNGGMLAFGPDGYLYVGVGDGGGANDTGNNAQNINTLLGKILRVDVDAPGVAYASPAGNPYVGSTPGRDEIFSIGWRNPWRFSFDRSTGQQWVADVGQGSREEVDTPIVAGGNYGWRVYEGTACTGLDPALCNPANYIAPLFDYTHAGGRCSITGGYVYRGPLGTLPAGTYVFGDFCTGEIMQWNGTQGVLLDTTLNISSFGEDELGEIYVVGLAGSVSRIASTTQSTVDIDASGTQTRYDGLTDGLLALRHMFGIVGPALTANALGPSATRTTPADVARYLDANSALLDIDGNGRLDALTDGLMILRYLFGLRGDALTHGAVGAGATRATTALLESYLRMLVP